MHGGIFRIIMNGLDWGIKCGFYNAIYFCMVAFRDTHYKSLYRSSLQVYLANTIHRYKYNIAYINVKKQQCQRAKKWLETGMPESIAYLRHIELIWWFYYRGYEVLKIREKDLDVEVVEYIVIHKICRSCFPFYKQNKKMIIIGRYRKGGLSCPLRFISPSMCDLSIIPLSCAGRV